MSDEELKELNFPVAVEKMLISNTAMLRTVLQNQMVIMEALKIGNNDTLRQQIDASVLNSITLVESDLKRYAPKSETSILPNAN